MNNFRHSGAACVVGASAPYNHGVPLAGEGRNPANKIVLLAFVLIATSAWYESVNANELGRLFYTPQQRQQLESQGTGGSSGSGNAEGVRRNYIIVNGVVQKHGGNRTVWINGAAQATERSNDKNPTTVPVTVPGKSQPVQLKVGQKLLLEAPAPAEDQ
jgi:hypothetical protein